MEKPPRLNEARLIEVGQLPSGSIFRIPGDEFRTIHAVMGVSPDGSRVPVTLLPSCHYQKVMHRSSKVVHQILVVDRNGQHKPLGKCSPGDLVRVDSHDGFFIQNISEHHSEVWVRGRGSRLFPPFKDVMYIPTWKAVDVATDIDEKNAEEVAWAEYKEKKHEEKQLVDAFDAMAKQVKFTADPSKFPPAFDTMVRDEIDKAYTEQIDKIIAEANRQATPSRLWMIVPSLIAISLIAAAVIIGLRLKANGWNLPW